MELTYRAFGLTISSELALPGLPAASGRPDIHVRRRQLPDWTGDATVSYGQRCRIRGHEWFIRFRMLPFTGLVRDGNTVEFDAAPKDDEAASLHVLGSCTGALLFQRGLMPLHGNTVISPDGAAMMVGRIGAGKSATTMALMQRGHRLLADDISALSFESDGQAPYIVPGFPRLKLWKTTLDRFECDPAQFNRLRQGLDKYHYPVDDLFCPEPQILRSIYILHPSDVGGVAIRTLNGLEKLDALRPHLYKLRFRDALRLWPSMMGKMCRLADTVRVSVVERPREGDTINEVAQAIERDLATDNHRSRNAASVA